MKTIAIALLAAVVLSACNIEQPNNTVTSYESDFVPCIKYAPITIGQHTYGGDANIYLTSTGIGITINEVNANVNTIHIKISPTQLSGNLAPGQFPIHISNPTFLLELNYTWAELGLEPTDLVYVYMHFETNLGTGWAGEFKRQGKGQWYYYSIVDDCN